MRYKIIFSCIIFSLNGMQTPVTDAIMAVLLRACALSKTEQIYPYDLVFRKLLCVEFPDDVEAEAFSRFAVHGETEESLGLKFTIADDLTKQSPLRQLLLSTKTERTAQIIKKKVSGYECERAILDKHTTRYTIGSDCHILCIMTPPDVLNKYVLVDKALECPPATRKEESLYQERMGKLYCRYERIEDMFDEA